MLLRGQRIGIHVLYSLIYNFKTTDSSEEMFPASAKLI